jgi:threonine dehydrogenase-like Zn-dependent dehydrogenase
MRATLLHAAGDVRVETVPDPVLHLPTDALVKVTHSCVCGSDLWPYRSYARDEPMRMGHEFIGVVLETGTQVTTLEPGDRVIAPFMYSDNTCPNCERGIHTSCLHGGNWGSTQRGGAVVDGGQGEYVRVPQADGTLVQVPADADFDALAPALLSLSDVMGTGHHAARAAAVSPGATVAVVGDGAVGLCAVLAARRLGAKRIILLGRSDERWQVAQAFGADERVTVRGDAAAEAVRDLTGGLGADAVLECVGTRDAMDTALAAARPGSAVGYVGVPQGLTDGRYAPLPLRPMFNRNVSLGGGMAPVRAYLPELLDEVLTGRLNPAPVFDLHLPLEQAADAYRAMNDRTAIKVLLQP